MLATLLCTGLCTPSGHGTVSLGTSSLGAPLPPIMAVAHVLLEIHLCRSNPGRESSA